MALEERPSRNAGGGRFTHPARHPAQHQGRTGLFWRPPYPVPGRAKLHPGSCLRCPGIRPGFCIRCHGISPGQWASQICAAHPQKATRFGWCLHTCLAPRIFPAPVVAIRRKPNGQAALSRQTNSDIRGHPGTLADLSPSKLWVDFPPVQPGSRKKGVSSQFPNGTDFRCEGPWGLRGARGVAGHQGG